MKIHSFESLDSTSDYLKENWIKYDEFDIVSTKIQPRGRGRHGGVWLSQEGMAMFTYYFKECELLLQHDYLKIPLIAGISVIEALQKYAQLEYMLKWTNDIYLINKKLGGILVEKQEDKIFIGIGLNINNEMPEEVKNIGVSLCSVTLKKYDLKEIILSIVQQFKKNYENYINNKNEWEKILEKINNINYLKNKEITLKTGNEVITGIAGNINNNGELEIKSGDNIVKSFSTGEVLKDRIILEFNEKIENTEKISELKKKGYDIVLVLFISENTNQNIINNFDTISKNNMLKTEKIYLKIETDKKEYLELLKNKYNAKILD